MTISPVIIASVIAGILGPMLTLFIKNYFDNKQNKPDIVAEALETSTKVMVKLDTIKEEFKADRIWITQFHNGGNFYPTGKSMAKFSVIYETVNIGVGSIQNMFQNIQVNLFSKSINELLKNDSIQIADYKDETIATFGLKYIADDTGCKSGYLFTIKTIDNKFIGVLGLDYTKKKVKLTEENINELLNYATAIGGVLFGHKEI
jgi:hypothetical protein